MPVINSATIETLTAEVRVLMVGSRQVTLSVYRQLDWAEWEDCEPFGRVNDKVHSGNSRTVVGKDKKTGQLVRAKLCHPDTWSYDDTSRWNELKNKKKWNLDEIQNYETKLPELKETLANQTLPLSERASAETSLRYLREPIRAKEELPKIESQLEELWKWKQQSDKNILWHRKEVAVFEALPLIVLAGLR